MTRNVRTTIASIAAVLTLSACLGACDDDVAEPPAQKTAPKAAAFYEPPKDLSSYQHGDLIWSSDFVGGLALQGAKNTRVLYAQEGVAGKTVATSGVVSIPQGKAPRGGWPVVTWAHGTTGIADQCAPSTFPAEKPSSGLFGDSAKNTRSVMQGWLDAGYAVVSTDYEGLGTPGDHPYLMGPSEGRAVLDIVSAARALDSDVGKRFLVSGHSQGGHAALWAASMAKDYVSDLDLVGVAAFAPASHLSVVVDVVQGGNSGVPAALVGLVMRGIDVGYPGEIPIEPLLTPVGQKLYAQTVTECLNELLVESKFAPFTAKEFGDIGSQADAIKGKINANDPAFVTISSPILIVQGLVDDTVPSVLSDSLAREYEGRSFNVQYKTFPKADHATILKRAEPTVLDFTAQAFASATQ